MQFFGTKVEITLIKAEPGHWVKLDFPRQVDKTVIPVNPEPEVNAQDDDGIDSDVDLDDIGQNFGGVVITEQF